MDYINKENCENLIIKNSKFCHKCTTKDCIKEDLKNILDKYSNIVTEKDIKFLATWLLDKNLWLGSENQELIPDNTTLSRGRVLLINPGTTNIGREQRYIHPYIVLGEYNETFIGVPVTNMAFNRKTRKFYLRHYFEVELIDPDYDKPFNEFRCTKPSVSDIRNIRGLDKRRIVVDYKKFVPSTYLNAISEKIRESLAIII